MERLFGAAKRLKLSHTKKQKTEKVWKINFCLLTVDQIILSVLLHTLKQGGIEKSKHGYSLQTDSTALVELRTFPSSSFFISIHYTTPSVTFHDSNAMNALQGGLP